MPDFALEDKYGEFTCGLDEVGRGPLAGPVVAACVYIPPGKRGMAFMPEIRDSKTLPEKKRNTLAALIVEHCAWSIEACEPEEIDTLNILWASMRAMEKAFHALPLREMKTALVDGNRVPKLPCHAVPVVKGDSISVSIAAASIIAKVHRDRIMRTLAEEFPHYGWDRNAGYPTAEHVAALGRHGITRHHRRSFGPVKACC